MFLQFHFSAVQFFYKILQEDGTAMIVIGFLPSSCSAMEDAVSDTASMITGSDVEPDSSQCTSHVQMDHAVFDAMPVEHDGCNTKKTAGIDFCSYQPKVSNCHMYHY